MFFTVIVPTYNPGQYLPKLLESIERNECIDDIEIILSDDCSEEPFEDVVESFKRLNIRTIVNEKHSGFPRDGRQNGARAAKGQWICFADQDDYYVDNAFDKIKERIEKEDLKNSIATNIIMHIDATGENIVYGGVKAWTHGKFYEKTFWDSHNLGYDYLRYCEDVNLSTKVGCIATTENLPINYVNECLYIWDRKEDSLSQGDYFPQSMHDYILGTLGVIVKYMEQYQYKKDAVEKLTIKFIQTLYHVYFYFQNDKLLADRMTVLDSAITIYPIYERFKKITGLTTADIINKTSSEWMELYTQERQDDFNQVHFFERMSLGDWMKAYMN